VDTGFPACAKPGADRDVWLCCFGGRRQAEKIMLKQKAKATWRFNLKSRRFG
jgi:hypothetical protein